jgi:hypothetical protein
MTTKLTLTIDKEIIERAKAYSKRQGSSLSRIVENYLKALVAPKQYTEEYETPLVQELKGSFRTPGDMDYKQSLSRSLKKKYL